jgi:hypothetical protein
MFRIPPQSIERKTKGGTVVTKLSMRAGSDNLP